MKCWEFVREQDSYRIEQKSRPDPIPKEGQVVVRIQAASLNYRDVIQWKNLAGRDVNGIIPLSDGAGEVVTRGPNVTEFQIGDRVCPNFFTGWTSGKFSMGYHATALGGPGCDGMLTELAVVPASALVKIPEFLTTNEAATLPCAAVTAWQALMVRGQLQSGQSILVIGTGGVSVFALQIGIAMGCRVIVVSRSEEKLQRAQSLGATDLIHSQTHPDWDKEVARLTDKRGVDHVIEVGGGGTLAKSITSVAAGGHIALIGVLTGFGPPKESLFPLLAKNATLSGIYVGSRDHFQELANFLVMHRIRPIIDRMFPFEQAPDAFSYLASGNHFGKIILANSAN